MAGQGIGREASAKVTGSLQKSTEIVKLSNQLIKLLRISQETREMSMKMTKAEADAEVDKVLFDLTNGKLGQVGTVENQLPVSTLSGCMR